MVSTKHFLAVVGPTASGKTEVACEIARRMPVEAISCDSMQVYESMPILTQVPPQPVRKLLRLHLVSFVPPDEEYHAARFRNEALGLIDEILKRGRTPLLVGGTGLYLRALLDGLFEGEKAGAAKDEGLRKKLVSEEEKQGPGYLHERLKKLDLPAAEKIHPHDLRRIVRALEVLCLTGRPFSSQKENRKGVRGDYAHRLFLLNRDRRDLYDRIDRRVDRMMDEGLVGEVRKLLRGNLSPTARMALGIREIQSSLEGKRGLDEAREILKRHTRNYAKRQLSWFRHEKGVETVDVFPEESPSETALKIMADYGQNKR
ncbi:MAG: tRNA (adenosine(37)-N6)-dimethylallyltransferase MiaA [Candidatus Omnitrophica bacterium]|nr:tRNA (adenosine(37)-N6)-dimethylallyltransferase MiaA [Candidatus Omnitrophota bacterium]